MREGVAWRWTWARPTGHVLALPLRALLRDGRRLRVCQRRENAVPLLCVRQPRDAEVLRCMRRPAVPGGPRGASAPRHVLYAPAPGPTHPDLALDPGGRTQARDRPVLRHDQFDPAGGAPG